MALLHSSRIIFECLSQNDKNRVEAALRPRTISFCRKCIRRGVSVVSHRHATANNEFLPYNNSDNLTSWILFVDANNFYGHEMSQPLPTRNFKFLCAREIEEFHMSITAATDDILFIIEVALNYIVHIHEPEPHTDYPFAAQKVKITQDILSPCSQSLINKCSSTENLTLNLNDKWKYVLHYKNLRLYLKFGWELVKIHKIFKFSQSTLLKPYIYFNTTKRKEAPSPFLQNFFKLFSNNAFGKTLKCLRNRMNLKLVTNPIRAKKHRTSYLSTIRYH